MAKRKTEFELQFGNGELHKSGTVQIVGEAPEHKPYVAIHIKDPKGTQTSCWIDDDEIELFAINILKALQSKRLKP